MKKYFFLYLLFSCYYSNGQTFSYSYYYYFKDAKNILEPEFYEMTPHKIFSRLSLADYEDFYKSNYSQKNISKVIRKGEDDSGKSLSVYLYDKGYITHEEHFALGMDGDTLFSFVCNYKYNNAKNAITSHVSTKRGDVAKNITLGYFFNRNFQLDSMAFEIDADIDVIRISHDSLHRIKNIKSRYTNEHYSYLFRNDDVIKSAADRIKTFCKNDTVVTNALNRFLSSSTNIKTKVNITEFEPTTDMLYATTTKSFLSVRDNRTIHFVYESHKNIVVDLWIDYLEEYDARYADNIRLFELADSGGKIIEENGTTPINKGVFKDGLLLKYENGKKKLLYSYF